MVNQKRIFILSGAGLSAPSGIKTFRSDTGLWEEHNVIDVATPEGFRRDPSLVTEFYNARRRDTLRAKPNAAHKALFKLEQSKHFEVIHYTQNIDNLCEKAGCDRVIHMHGSVMEMRCLNCNSVISTIADTSMKDQCISCKDIGCLRPNVVWFGEMPYGLDMVNDLIESCDLMIVVGTSGNVAPASEFVRYANCYEKHAVLLNLEETQSTQSFNEVILGDCSKTLPQYVDELIETKGKVY